MEIRAKKWFQRIGYGSLLCLLLANGAVLASPTKKLESIDVNKENTQILAGSFFQPSLVTNWTESDFAAEYEAMKKVSMDHIIWQWTVDTKEKKACYPTVLSGYTQIFHEDKVYGVWKYQVANTVVETKGVVITLNDKILTRILE